MKHYKITLGPIAEESYIAIIVAESQEAAIDKLADYLIENESEYVADYYDLMDEKETCEPLDEYLDRYGLICAGELGGYLQVANVEVY